VGNSPITLNKGKIAYLRVMGEPPTFPDLENIFVMKKHWQGLYLKKINQGVIMHYNKMSILLTILFLFILIGNNKVIAQTKKEIPNYKTISAVAEGALKAIEANDADNLIVNYMAPSIVTKLKKTDEVYKNAKKMMIEGVFGKQLALALKESKSITPDYDEKTDTLIFKINKLSTDGKSTLKSLTFIREKEKWYIFNVSVSIDSKE
jgi:hypothetical protein